MRASKRNKQTPKTQKKAHLERVGIQDALLGRVGRVLQEDDSSRMQNHHHGHSLLRRQHLDALGRDLRLVAHKTLALNLDVGARVQRFGARGIQETNLVRLSLVLRKEKP